MRSLELIIISNDDMYGVLHSRKACKFVKTTNYSSPPPPLCINGLSSSPGVSSLDLYNRTLQTIAQMSPSPKIGVVNIWIIPIHTVGLLHSVERNADIIVPIPGAMILITKTINAGVLHVQLDNTGLWFVSRWWKKNLCHHGSLFRDKLTTKCLFERRLTLSIPCGIPV